ncbi:hypothetical protein BDV95DRAFT_478930 [Massariosphaeria phaeospora]|uniref:CID domain-containing protein n=1 Tax=Massariosphaeria phaeospora TaxID=100035 RepID=A0A7C8IIW5_9PLEO|nr:hypothetical protein BDV95DRAFT_478930 [Massariosphaeria phaeospora]
MSLPSVEVAADFKDALQDLKQNNRPEISNLTIIAKENTEHAQAISVELENHIRTTRPEWKLPALYVLDSIVKNVGTPYTVYLGRNLYRTFMDAYTLMDQGTRKAMEGLLRTWKQPVPESMEARPVFSPDVTRDIENALNKYSKLAMQHGLPARPVSNPAWRNTPTPPQNITRYAAPNDPRVRQPFPPTQQYGHFPATPPTQYPSMQPYPQPVSSSHLEDLKAEVAKLIATTQNAFASNLADVSLRTKLQALLDLQKILNTQTLPPQQLEAVRKQVQALAPSTPYPNFVPSVPIQPPQQPLPMFPPAGAPVNIAQLLANAGIPAPPSSTPVAPTPSLADMLRRVSSPAQPSSTPTPNLPFFLPGFSAPPAIPTSVPAAVPASAPAQTGTPTANLAQLLSQFGKPIAAPALVTAPQQPNSLPQLLAQSPSAPTIGSADWLINALKGVPASTTPSSSTPFPSASMARQLSAPINIQAEVELTTASMKKPRLHLISKLYEAIPNICATCGRRFENTPEGKQKKARHMDWHFKVKDPDAAKRGVHRSWYISEKEWIDYREVDETSPEQTSNGAIGSSAAVKKQAKDKYVPVPQDPTLLHAPCPICQEKFDPRWLVEANDFVWMDATKVGGKIYHATCWEEYSKGAGIPTPSTPDSVLGKRKAEVSTPASAKKVRAY